MERTRHPDGLVHGVIVGLQRGDGRWLLIRRSAHVAAPLQVCFPGGGIELGEDHAHAAQREVKEELGLTVRAGREIWVWRAPDRPLQLFGWSAVCDWDLSDASLVRPEPLEVAEVLWLTAAQARAHPDRLFGTEFFVDALLAHSSTHPQPPKPRKESSL